MSEKIVVFDIIGTCFSLEKPRQQLLKLGAPHHALELWFAQALRDAFALSHAGAYQPLKQILEAQLPRTLQTLAIELNSEQRSHITTTLAELELQPFAKEAFQHLSSSGWQIIALTNGSKDATNKLLQRAQVEQYFAQIYSCDEVAITKPHPRVYQMVSTSDLNNVWLVAAHAWDIAGAIQVGMKTAFVSQLENSYLQTYPQPQIKAKNLLEAVQKIMQH